MMEEILPKGWEYTTLKEVSLSVEKIDPRKEPNLEFKYIDISSINSENFKIEKPKFLNGSNAPSRARQLVKKEDIIISTVRPYLKRIAKIDENYHNQVASTGFAVVRLINLVDSSFYFYFSCSETFIQNLTDLQRGASYPAVRNSDVFSQIIPLPPLPEQKRIVAKLDKLFGNLEHLKTRLARIPSLLSDFRQSVLTQAVTGKLTEEWRIGKELEKHGVLQVDNERIREYELLHLEAKKRKERKPKKPSNLEIKYFKEINHSDLLPSEWNTVPLVWLSDSRPDSIVDGPFGSSINVNKDYVSQGVPVVRIFNVRPFLYNEKKLKYVRNEKFKELKRHNILPEDILLAKVGATIGDCCKYPIGYPEAMLSTTGNCRIRVDKKLISPEYLELFLNSKKLELKSIASQTAQPFLNMKTVKGFPIHLPSISEQKQIVSQVDYLFAKANKIESRYQSLKANIEVLPQAILAKAFRGELVAQLETDGDAKELLKEIAKLRVEMKAKPKKRKKK